jgi:hypothetical protein
MGHPMRIGAWVISPRAGWATEPHFVALLVAHSVGQMVIPSFQPVTSQFQVLAGIIVDVV